AVPSLPPAHRPAATRVRWRWVATQSPSAPTGHGPPAKGSTSPIRRSVLMRALCRHHWGHFVVCEIREHIPGYAGPFPSPTRLRVQAFKFHGGQRAIGAAPIYARQHRPRELGNHEISLISGGPPGPLPPQPVPRPTRRAPVNGAPATAPRPRRD